MYWKKIICEFIHYDEFDDKCTCDKIIKLNGKVKHKTYVEIIEMLSVSEEAHVVSR